MENQTISKVQDLYHQLIEAWNNRNARGMADLFTEDGTQIGFDGSLITRKEEIYEHVAPIFRDHPTAPFITKIKEISLLGPHAVLLRAIAGMPLDGQNDINPDVNAHQTMVAINQNGVFRVKLFQNTPAQFHGRPELVKEMTAELRELLH